MKRYRFIDMGTQHVLHNAIYAESLKEAVEKVQPFTQFRPCGYTQDTVEWELQISPVLKHRARLEEVK